MHKKDVHKKVIMPKKINKYHYGTYLSDHFPLKQGKTLSWNIMTQGLGGNNGFGQTEELNQYKERLWQIALQLRKMLEDGKELNKAFLQEVPVTGPEAEYFRACLAKALPQNWKIAPDITNVNGASFGNLTLYNSDELKLDVDKTKNLRAEKIKKDKETNNQQAGRSQLHVFTNTKTNKKEIAVNVHHTSRKIDDNTVRADHQQDIKNYKDLLNKASTNDTSNTYELVLGGDVNASPNDLKTADSNIKSGAAGSIVWVPKKGETVAHQQGTLNCVDCISSSDPNPVSVMQENAKQVMVIPPGVSKPGNTEITQLASSRFEIAEGAPAQAAPVVKNELPEQSALLTNVKNNPAFGKFQNDKKIAVEYALGDPYHHQYKPDSDVIESRICLTFGSRKDANAFRMGLDAIKIGDSNNSLFPTGHATFQTNGEDEYKVFIDKKYQDRFLAFLKLGPKQDLNAVLASENTLAPDNKPSSNIPSIKPKASAPVAATLPSAPIGMVEINEADFRKHANGFVNFLRDKGGYPGLQFTPDSNFQGGLRLTGKYEIGERETELRIDIVTNPTKPGIREVRFYNQELLDAWKKYTNPTAAVEPPKEEVKAKSEEQPKKEKKKKESKKEESKEKEEEKKDATKTEEQKEQEELRKKQMEKCSSLYWDKIKRKPQWKRRDGKEPEPATHPGLGQLSKSSSTNAKTLNEGHYDIEYYEEEKRVLRGRKKKTMSFYVDKEGKIKPSAPLPDVKKDPKGHKEAVRQYIRGYTQQGINKLTLDYPGCYDQGSPPKPDPEKCKNISLKDMMAKLEVAAKEKPPVAILIAPGSAAEQPG